MEMTNEQLAAIIAVSVAEATKPLQEKVQKLQTDFDNSKAEAAAQAAAFGTPKTATKAPQTKVTPVADDQPY